MDDTFSGKEKLEEVIADELFYSESFLDLELVDTILDKELNKFAFNIENSAHLEQIKKLTEQEKNPLFKINSSLVEYFSQGQKAEFEAELSNVECGFISYRDTKEIIENVNGENEKK